MGLDGVAAMDEPSPWPVVRDRLRPDLADGPLFAALGWLRRGELGGQSARDETKTLVDALWDGNVGPH